ncbi:phosphotransferase [Maribius pontilimi]|uniref:Phosphotransferase n=1 Tax=Palleronia pontilimi TaxID=1964209 RepID=A0A934MCT2_9RHOB|nr:phosphotransferase [Palleronia pontilimi]MBJ3762840.1 phosphotransferase [Palleronia pontilimi]
MIEGLGISQDALGDWLTAHVDGFRSLERVEKFSGGQSNPTYRIIAASGNFVLRAKPPGELLKSAHQVDREYRVMAALADTHVPVPRMFALADDETSPIGRAFFVMEHLQGRIFWDPALPDETPQTRAAIYDAMNATLAHLHMVDVDAAGLGDFGKPGNYFARQTDRWSRQYRASVDAPSDDMARLMDWLPDHMPADDGAVALVHGDYRLDNMIFAPQAPEVIGLLDWELSTLGHPLADLAYQCMQWRLPHDGGMRGLGGLDRADLGLPSERDYVARYCERRGIGDIDNWPFYLVFSFFRLASILQGVFARAQAGNASNPEKARQYGEAVPVLARMARDLTEGKAA